MPTLTIIALSTPCTISLAALNACREAARLFVQTKETPCVNALRTEGIPFETMDDLYELAGDFDALNESIRERLFQALQNGDVAYAVAGGGMGDALYPLQSRAKMENVAARIIPGVSYARAALGASGLGADRLTIAAATALPAEPDTDTLFAIEQTDTRIRAGEVKLYLQEYYPDAHLVQLCRMREDGAYETEKLPLYALDRGEGFHATTVLIVPPAPLLKLERFGYRDLLKIMHILYSPGGCPWDAEQTHESLKKTMVEECYEVLDAIDKKDDFALSEELGDVLLQCVFHSEIAETEGRFNARDVSTEIVKKLIYRHPHIFADGTADTPDAVITRWEELKKKEKHFNTQTEVLEAVPNNLPALMRAAKVQKKAAQVGFDWDRAQDAIEKLKEETEELVEAIDEAGAVAEEMGDLLFAAVNVARLLKLEPEELLQNASAKFVSRFGKMEQLAMAKGSNLKDLTLAEQDLLWNAVKSEENSQK